MERNSNIRNSLYRRLQQRMASTVGHRGDLYLADYRVVNAGAAKIAAMFRSVFWFGG